MLTTIGYERSALADFIATLVATKVEVLVDIRDRAQSRVPGFSKTALSDAVREAGLEYLHIPSLGDPKPGRDAARAGNYDAFREIFQEVLNSENGKSALNELKELAKLNHICLMCFERDQRECHRKMVSDYLEESLRIKAVHLGVQRGAAKRAA